jgi:hypothetical protein
MKCTSTLSTVVNADNCLPADPVTTNSDGTIAVPPASDPENNWNPLTPSKSPFPNPDLR